MPLAARNSVRPLPSPGATTPPAAVAALPIGKARCFFEDTYEHLPGQLAGLGVLIGRMIGRQ